MALEVYFVRKIEPIIALAIFLEIGSLQSSMLDPMEATISLRQFSNQLHMKRLDIYGQNL